MAEKRGAAIHVATEDGSEGFHGTASKLADNLILKTRPDWVYTCGPELMVKNVVSLALREHLPVEASLERIVKCGVGLCGSCLISGFRVCSDGPVFTGEQLADVADFGSCMRDHAGRKQGVAT